MTDGPNRQVRISITMHWFLLSFALGSVSGPMGSCRTKSRNRGLQAGPHSGYSSSGGVGPSGFEPESPAPHAGRISCGTDDARSPRHNQATPRTRERLEPPRAYKCIRALVRGDPPPRAADHEEDPAA